MKEESLLLLSDLQKLINQVVLIDYTIIILGCDCIRPDRLRIQHRIVYRKYLDKDFTGKWGYEDTDDRTDCGGTG